jgi:hypothetical protein
VIVIAPAGLTDTVTIAIAVGASVAAVCLLIGAIVALVLYRRSSSDGAADNNGAGEQPTPNQLPASDSQYDRVSVTDMTMFLDGDGENKSNNNGRTYSGPPSYHKEMENRRLSQQLVSGYSDLQLAPPPRTISSLSGNINATGVEFESVRFENENE